MKASPINEPYRLTRLESTRFLGGGTTSEAPGQALKAKNIWHCSYRKVTKTSSFEILASSTIALFCPDKSWPHAFLPPLQGLPVWLKYFFCCFFFSVASHIIWMIFTSSLTSQSGDPDQTHATCMDHILLHPLQTRIPSFGNWAVPENLGYILIIFIKTTLSLDPFSI